MNNKGFMLAETIVVSAVLIGTMVSMYVGYNKLYIQYQKRSNYYDVDSIYAAKAIEDELVDNEGDNEGLNNINEITNLFEIPSDFISSLRTNLNIKQAYIIPTTKFKSYTTEDNDRAEYMNYLKQKITDEDIVSNNFIIIIIRESDNKTKFGYLKVA